MYALLAVATIALVVFLGWNLRRRIGADRIQALAEKRRPKARMMSRGDLVDGNRHIEVAMALIDSTLVYENSDMEASLDLRTVREIEYDNRLVTGGAVGRGKVMRLRCHSQSFEFVLADEAVARWQDILPARREAESLTGSVMATGIASTT